MIGLISASLAVLTIVLFCFEIILCEYYNEFHLSPDVAQRDQTGHIRNRTAVLVSGQLRGGNITFDSGYLKRNANLAMFGYADPPTVILTQIEWFLKPLVERGGVDVFMYVEAHPEDIDYVWDGNPINFRPRPGDVTACNPYASHPLFHTTGSRLFCMVDVEVQLMNGFLRNFSTWTHYTYNSERLNEQALRQYYGMYRANLASKQYAIANNIKYTYKVRLRPDTAFVKPPPDFKDINFKLNLPDCDSMVYFASKAIYHNGNEDWFNFGLAEDMNRVLDRYEDLTTDPFYGNKSGKNYFDLEDHLTQTMLKKYRICMTDHHEFWMVVIRLNGHQLNTWQPPVNRIDWIELSSFSSTGTVANASSISNATKTSNSPISRIRRRRHM